ncbi:TPA: hypothetical protein U2M28_003955 [Providencia stuartii]|uniref:hypothetical protein n=1 Tax=Providencia stuartii TaxID=588 RepID=UPI002AB45B1A|nr:hypothetical protein [Providencia stuartii]HEM8208482.1 hypothetical protein [Providencia stuartii]
MKEKKKEALNCVIGIDDGNSDSFAYAFTGVDKDLVMSAVMSLGYGASAGHAVQGGMQQQESKLMSDKNITKAELDALLKANKAEVEVVAANIQKEMAEWREHQNEQMSKVVTALSTLDVKLDERYENQKLSTTRTQWLVGIAIAVAALVPAFIGIFKADTPQQPTVIYVQQPAPQSTEAPAIQK